jgi:hypothetical protein
MPLPTTHKLFIDVKAGLAYNNFASSSPVNFPSFYLGDQAKLQVFFIEETGVASYPRQEVAGLGSPGIRVAIGKIDESPTAGHFTLGFGGQTSAALDYNVTASKMDTELNKLSTIQAAGGVTVTKVGDNYAIKFNTNGNRAAFTSDATSLIPISNVGISVLQEGDLTRPEIILVHLQQTVAALATVFTALPEAEAQVETLSAWDGSRVLYRLAISPDPKGGTFSLVFNPASGSDISTASISVGSTALDVQNLLAVGTLATKVTVQQVSAFAYDVAISLEPGSNGLTANSAGLLSFNGFQGDLNVATANAVSYLDGANFIETTLEVEIADGVSRQTILQIPCLLKSAVIDEAAIEPVVLDPVLSQAEADGRYLMQSNNLADLQSASEARDNLDVYSQGETDTLLAGKYDATNPAGYQTASQVADAIAAIPSGSDEIKPYRYTLGFGADGRSGTLMIGAGTTITSSNSTLQLAAPTAVQGQASVSYFLHHIQKDQPHLGALDFSKQINLSVNIKFQQTQSATDANTANRVFLGISSFGVFSNTINSNNGFGFIRRADGTINLLTKIGANAVIEESTGFTPVNGQTYNITIKCLADGSAQVLINGVLVLTSTNAPYQNLGGTSSTQLCVESGNFAAITGLKANLLISNLIIETVY